MVKDNPCLKCMDTWCCPYLLTDNPYDACAVKIARIAETTGIDGDDFV